MRERDMRARIPGIAGWVGWAFLMVSGLSCFTGPLVSVDRVNPPPYFTPGILGEKFFENIDWIKRYHERNPSNEYFSGLAAKIEKHYEYHGYLYKPQPTEDFPTVWCDKTKAEGVSPSPATPQVVETSRATTPGVKPILAVFDPEDKGAKLGEEMLDRLADYIGTLLTAKGYQVIPRSQIQDRIQAQKKDSYKVCYDQSCQIEVGQELAAQKSLAIKIMKLGKRCMVTLNLYDLKRAASERGATAEGPCSEDDIVNSLQKAVGDLLK
jgi:hypothetical protein